MSWGEQSCEKYGDCKIANMTSCNKNCEEYVEDEFYIPPPIPMNTGAIVREQPTGPVLIRSPFKKLNKKKEMIILHGCIYEVSTIAPRKVTLKLKSNLTKANIEAKTQMIDGVFVWTDKGEVLDFAKVLRENRIELKKKAVQESESIPLDEDLQEK